MINYVILLQCIVASVFIVSENTYGVREIVNTTAVRRSRKKRNQTILISKNQSNSEQCVL